MILEQDGHHDSDDWRLERVGSLYFDFTHGTCATAKETYSGDFEEFIIMCFATENEEYEETKTCFKTKDLKSFEQMEDSNFDHSKSRIAASEGQFTLIYRRAFYSVGTYRNFTDINK